MHPGGFRTHNLNSAGVTDQRLRRRDHWDRHIIILKGKAIPITEGSGRLRIQITRHSAAFTPKNILVLILEAQSTLGHTEISAATE